MKGTWLAATLLAAHVAASAAPTTFTATGQLDTTAFAEKALVEAWGKQGEAAIGSASSSFQLQGLVDFLSPYAQQAAAYVPRATALFTYDPAAPALQTTLVDANRGSARFAIAQLDVTVAGSGLQHVYRSEVSSASRTMGRGFDQIRISRSVPTVDGPIPGSAPIETGLEFDDLQFDLGGFIQEHGSRFAPAPGHMPVRLSWDGRLDAVGLLVAFVRMRGQAPLDLTLPTGYDPADHDLGAAIAVAYDGVFAVSISPDDYLSFEDYVAAKGWVDGNLRQLNIEWSAEWLIDAVRSAAAPVPEPGTWALAGLGLALLAARARRRVSAPA